MPQSTFAILLSHFMSTCTFHHSKDAFDNWKYSLALRVPVHEMLRLTCGVAYYITNYLVVKKINKSIIPLAVLTISLCLFSFSVYDAYK